MANALGLKVTSVRTKLYEMGYYKMRMEYWTEEQVAFLNANYQTLGDTELAEIFSQKWHKDKGWDKKHIEKKRRYLILKRTTEEKKAIHQRNIDMGCYSMCAKHAWKTRGVSAEGVIRMWRTNNSERLIPHIKIGGQYIHWNRWFWEQQNGPIPNDHYIVFVGDPSILTIENLRCISIEEYKREFNNKAVIELSDNYVASMLSHKNKSLRALVKGMPELIQAKRNQLLLNRKIKNHGTEQNDRP
ncbi:MAG: hypothetical protein EOO20_09495 [Chryseobacterium sp.]|nr:MAG: hypothetical protein EOO20_09495 [Chryseobacterium sp.]